MDMAVKAFKPSKGNVINNGRRSECPDDTFLETNHSAYITYDNYLGNGILLKWIKIFCKNLRPQKYASYLAPCLSSFISRIGAKPVRAFYAEHSKG